MPQQLSEEELQNALSAQALSGWSVLNGTHKDSYARFAELHKVTNEFADFDATWIYEKSII